MREFLNLEVLEWCLEKSGVYGMGSGTESYDRLNGSIFWFVD